MKCRSAERLLLDYIEGTLSPKQVYQLELHIDDCIHCQEELKAFETTIRLASNLPIRYPSPQAWEAFWPDLRMKIAQSQVQPKHQLPLWMKVHQWKIVGASCVLMVLLTVWGISNSGLFTSPTVYRTSTFDELMAQSVIVGIPVKQWKDELDDQIQILDSPLTWVDEMSLVDEIHSPNTVQSDALVDELFQVIATEIDLESFGHEAATDLVASTNDRSVLIALGKGD